jgi:hypothetical protein
MDRHPSRRFCASAYSSTILAFTTLVSMWLPQASVVRADLFTYTNANQFATAIAGRVPTTVNFDSSADGTVIPNNSIYQQIRFDPNNTVNGDLIVSNGSVSFAPGLRTFSGSNYLGSSIGDVIKQSFVFSFQSPMNSVGLYIISPSQLGTGEVGITVGSTSVLINRLEEISLASTGGNTPSFAYFLGIAESNPSIGFTAVTVNPNISGIVDGIGIDNISFTAVPEPSTFLTLTGFAMAIGLCSSSPRKLIDYARKKRYSRP